MDERQLRRGEDRSERVDQGSGFIETRGIFERRGFCYRVRTDPVYPSSSQVSHHGPYHEVPVVRHPTRNVHYVVDRCSCSEILWALLRLLPLCAFFPDFAVALVDHAKSALEVYDCVRDPSPQSKRLCSRSL